VDEKSRIPLRNFRPIESSPSHPSLLPARNYIFCGNGAGSAVGREKKKRKGGKKKRREKSARRKRRGSALRARRRDCDCPYPANCLLIVDSFSLSLSLSLIFAINRLRGTRCSRCTYSSCTRKTVSSVKIKNTRR